MKKRLLVVIGLAVILAVVVGCGGGEETGGIDSDCDVGGSRRLGAHTLRSLTGLPTTEQETRTHSILSSGSNN